MLFRSASSIHNPTVLNLDLSLTDKFIQLIHCTHFSCYFGFEVELSNKM